MFNSFSLLSRNSRRRIVYPLVSFVLVFSLVVGIPQVTQARSLLDIIFQGIQIVQLSNISDRQEAAIGKQINEQLVNNQFDLYNNSQITRYINDIGQRLAKQSQRPNITYNFQIVDDPNINAAATMGGYIYVNRGLIAAADNEAQLASVIAHEIGHIAARHSIQQMRQTAIARGLAVAAGVDRNTLVNLGVELAFKLPNSRKDELEADKLGLETLQKSGYAPSAMVEFMKKLLNSGRSAPTILSSHPATSDRITALNQAIDPAIANVGDGLNNNAYKTKIRPVL
ncbi:MAG TPA: peptidase [Cyanobacteria bacterium UBA11149]|nr:peptidase [Cyanobacteria bacterium UBA11367]HBE58798.1 peptidase [Cyanobacteria bacterium UBA11366]HBK64059.1 peptidase [Cyanobacteria bacterium UBA11166]HBR75226.1 peptidase [Cyanobacteria bacterium UBA11159]HBS72417.1 peptidase [Cyanobacteria bacterium UBA11153]HBW89118.1 peptidase [Cyanobacteria bacterium UBA11149]HCA94629.1 peptidase [Cyanobacteria bacterium UBA9226]